jgi:signal transduction histidine kinase
MEKFIDDIVNYSRNSRTELKLEWINICQMINDLQQSYAYFENANKIAFDNCIQANEVVYSDQYRLQVILNNIISNAFKYSDMSKSNPFIKISCLNHCGHQIIIEDNGKGIENEYLPKIFDMFYRASTGSNGSGLGLYIAMESARNINCRLEVESEYGNGTLFKINIPEYVSA